MHPTPGPTQQQVREPAGSRSPSPVRFLVTLFTLKEDVSPWRARSLSVCDDFSVRSADAGIGSEKEPGNFGVAPLRNTRSPRVRAGYGCDAAATRHKATRKKKDTRNENKTFALKYPTVQI